MWQLSQVTGYFVGLAVCVAGLFERWQLEQFVVVTTWLIVAHDGYLWHEAQVAGYSVEFAI